MDKIAPLAAGVAATGLAIASATVPRLAEMRDACIQPGEVVCYERAPEPWDGQEREVERATPQGATVEASASGPYWASNYWAKGYWSQGYWKGK